MMGYIPLAFANPGHCS